MTKNSLYSCRLVMVYLIQYNILYCQAYNEATKQLLVYIQYIIVTGLKTRTMHPRINILFAYCKGGNFNTHIWPWFGYFICYGREIRFYL